MLLLKQTANQTRPWAFLGFLFLHFLRWALYPAHFAIMDFLGAVV